MHTPESNLLHRCGAGQSAASDEGSNSKSAGKRALGEAGTGAVETAAQRQSTGKFGIRASMRVWVCGRNMEGGVPGNSNCKIFISGVLD